MALTEAVLDQADRAYPVESAALYGHGTTIRDALLSVLAAAELEGLVDNTANLIITVSFATEDFEATLVVTD
jgi:hypothetical protein